MDDQNCKLRTSLLNEGKLPIQWEQYCFVLEQLILKTKEEKSPEIQTGWLLTGDGYKLNAGDSYHSVYVSTDGIYRISKEFVDANTTYGSDYYHTRYKHYANAQKFIDDCCNNKFDQLQIKHACIHVGIDVETIEKLYSFLQQRAINRKQNGK